MSPCAWDDSIRPQLLYQPQTELCSSTVVVRLFSDEQLIVMNTGLTLSSGWGCGCSQVGGRTGVCQEAQRVPSVRQLRGAGQRSRHWSVSVISGLNLIGSLLFSCHVLSLDVLYLLLQKSPGQAPGESPQIVISAWCVFVCVFMCVQMWCTSELSTPTIWVLVCSSRTPRRMCCVRSLWPWTPRRWRRSWRRPRGTTSSSWRYGWSRSNNLDSSQL